MWTVLHDLPRVNRQRVVLVRCTCGVERAVNHYTITSGRSISCGCLKIKTGHTIGKPSRTYVSWQSMRTRCLNPRSSDYPYYGGRGIRIHPAWDEFAQFLSDMGVRPAGCTLDRRDVNGPYSADNCRWATNVEQRHNQRPHKRSANVQDSPHRP